MDEIIYLIIKLLLISVTVTSSTTDVNEILHLVDSRDL